MSPRIMYLFSLIVIINTSKIGKNMVIAGNMKLDPGIVISNFILKYSVTTYFPAVLLP